MGEKWDLGRNIKQWRERSVGEKYRNKLDLFVAFVALATCRRRGYNWPLLTDRTRLHAAGCAHGLHWRRAVLSSALSLSNTAGRPASIRMAYGQQQPCQRVMPDGAMPLLWLGAILVCRAAATQARQLHSARVFGRGAHPAAAIALMSPPHNRPSSCRHVCGPVLFWSRCDAGLEGL